MAPLGMHRQSLGVPRMKSGGPDTTIPGEKPPTTLKLWIIRLQSGGVVVEGYKTVSENDSTTLLNWRSTVIESRIDAKTLVTHSGSVYKLKGSIDEDEAAEAGIPSELIEEFTDGFPENWKELIQDQLKQNETLRLRRQSTINTTNTMEEEGGMDTVEMEEERLKEAKKRRSLQKGRKSLIQRVQPGTPIVEEEEEGETPGRRKTPSRRNGTSETPVGRKEERKTPRGRGRGRESTQNEEEGDKEEKEVGKAGVSRSTPKTANREKRTPRGRKKTGDEEKEDEVFATPNEIPRRRETKSLALAMPPDRNDGRHRQRRVSLEDIPAEVMSKSVKLTRWVIRFVRAGSDTSPFPHFQFKVCGFRPESDENEWCTSAIQKVVPPHLMFTSSSIYLLDGRMDIDQSAAMGFPPRFITDFVLGFPDDWHIKLGTFYDRVFGPQPAPTLRIVELTSDGGTAEEGRMDETTRKREAEEGRMDETTRKREEKKSITPRTRDGQKYRADGLYFEFDEMPECSRKRKEPTPSSSSSSDEESMSEGEKQLRREAIRVEKEERRREEKARREAEMKAKAKEEKKKRFEVTVNTTPDGVRISRSGRTLRTPLATWAGEYITYDVRGNVVDMQGVTTITRLTVGKTNNKETELLAAHYGVESPLNEPMQKERAIVPPSASRPKTPVPKKSKADYRGFSDDETDQIPYNEYLLQKRREAEATPAFNLKKGKKRCNVIESSDSEAEEAARKKEEKRRKREEKRRLRESEEEEESSDDGWRRKKRSKKKVNVKKEKQAKRAPSKKKRSKKESEEEEESELEIEHDDDAVTFVPSENGGNEGGNGYSDDELMRLEEERDREEEREETSEKKKPKKKQPVKRAKEWKKEELIRLKLAITAQSPGENGLTREGWEKVAKSVGGERTVEQCQKAARERLKMKVDEVRSDAESGEASEDEDKANRRNAKLNDENRPKGVTAKKGTLQYAVEMENAKRDLLMGGSASQEDYFKDKMDELVGSQPLPSVETFDPNDSLLSVLDDSPAPKQRTTKTARAAAAPATPALSSFNGSMTDSADRSTRRSSRFYQSPVIDPAQMTRYVHQLSRQGNFSMVDRTMAERSRMMPPKIPKGNIVAREAAKIEKATKQLNRGRRGNEMGDLNEDEENEEGNILDGL